MLFAHLKRILKLDRLRLRGLTGAHDEFLLAATAGSGGLESASLAQLLTAPSRFWALGPLLAMPLLDGGARQATSREAHAGYDGAVADYRQSALAAFQEVEDSLASLRILSDEAQVQTKAVDAAERTLALALNRYRAGATAYLDVVVSQTAALSSQRVALDVARRRMLASVLLIKALGGGWQQGCDPRVTPELALARSCS